jgi:hypothetical protein
VCITRCRQAHFESQRVLFKRETNDSAGIQKIRSFSDREGMLAARSASQATFHAYGGF